MHLTDVHARPGAARRAGEAGEAHPGQHRIGSLLTAVFGGEVAQHFGVAACLDPARAQRRQAGADVDFRRRVGIRTRAVVDENRRVGLRAGAAGAGFAAEHQGRIGLADFSHRDTDIGLAALHVDLARIGQGLHRGLVNVGSGSEELRVGVHVALRKTGGVRSASLDNNGGWGSASLVQRRDCGPASLVQRGRLYVSLPTAVSTASGSKGMSHSSRCNRRLETPGKRLKVAEMWNNCKARPHLTY